jgi:hypothetical protein
MEKTRYKYFTGRPSWHQSRAGHSCSGVLIVDHTPAEHATFIRNYEKRGEPVTWQILAPSAAR